MPNNDNGAEREGEGESEQGKGQPTVALVPESDPFMSVGPKWRLDGSPKGRMPRVMMTAARRQIGLSHNAQYAAFDA